MVADSNQTKLCAYVSAILLGGLVLNAATQGVPLPRHTPDQQLRQGSHRELRDRLGRESPN